MKRIMKNVISCIMMITILVGLVSYAAPTVTAQASGTTMNLTVTHPDMNTIKLFWTKLDNAYGYKVYYKASGSATYELVSETLDNKMVFDGLKNDYFYYFKVDAYSVVNGQEVVVGTTGERRAQSNKIGIDVSKHNGTIDWNKVKADGIEYAIVRVAYGTDPKWEKMYKENIEGAQKAGIPVGVYIYSLATDDNSARKEADYVINLLKGFKLQYPVAFDIEDAVQKDGRNNSNGRKKNTSLTKVFCDKIKAAGYTPMIYTGCSFSRTYLNMSDLSQYDLWIAHYGSDSEYTSYKGSYHYGSTCNAAKTRIWQYSSRGRVDGIKGNVDMNYELDLKQSVYGMAHYNVSNQIETYVAANGESLDSIADKYNISVQQLIKYDSKYQTNSWIGKGSTIMIDSTYLSGNGKKVADVARINPEITDYNTLTVYWTPVNYSDGYYVYRSTSWNGTYTKIATVNGTNYRDTGLKSRQTYYYRVYAYKKTESGVNMSQYATTAGNAPRQETPWGLKKTATTYNSVTLSWNKSRNASYYKIYMATSKNGTYKKVGTSKTNSFTHKNLKYGQNYYYKVEAMRTVNGKNYWSNMSNIVSAKPQLDKVNLKSVTAGSKKATLKWNSVKGAKGYMVYRSTSKNGKYQKIATVGGTSYTSKGLTKNKKYYYKVRAYRVVSGKNVYGAYSSIKNVKAK